MRLISVLALLIRHHEDDIRVRMGILQIRDHRVERPVKGTGTLVRALSDRTVAIPEIIGTAKYHDKVRCLVHRVHPVDERSRVV